MAGEETTPGESMTHPQGYRRLWLLSLTLLSAATAIAAWNAFGAKRLNEVEQQVVGEWFDVSSPDRKFSYRADRTVVVSRDGKATSDELDWSAEGGEMTIVQYFGGGSIVQRIRLAMRNALSPHTTRYALRLGEDEITLGWKETRGTKAGNERALILRRVPD